MENSVFVGLETIEDFMEMLTSEEGNYNIERAAQELETVRECFIGGEPFVRPSELAQKIAEHYGIDDYGVCIRIEGMIENSGAVDIGDPDGEWPDLCGDHADRAKKER